MAKLIYVNKTKANAIAAGGIFGSSTTDWTASSNKYYHSIVFTNDGHILTHGIDFSQYTDIATNLKGGAAGSLPYQTGDSTTSFLAAPSSGSNAANGDYILSFSSNAPIWKKIVNYKLTLNDTTAGDSNGTSLGSFYAPTEVGTAGQVLVSTGSTTKVPAWKTLSTDFESIASSGDLSIPTRTAVKNYVDTQIANSVSSVFTPKGTFDGIDSSTKKPKNGSTVVSTLAIGDAYTYNGTNNLTLDAANSASGSEEILQAGDTIICTDKTTPKYSVLQANWSASAGTSTLAWNTEVTLATIGGVAIKAKLPTNPNSNTTYSFFVGGSGATANASTTNNTGAYLTVKPSTSETASNIFKLVGSGVAKVNNTLADNLNTITIDVPITAVGSSRTTSSSPNSGYSNAGSITINGTTYYFDYKTDTNTWRGIYVDETSKVETGVDTKAINFKAGSNVTLTHKAAGTGTGQSGSANYSTIEIAASNTWREIDVYKIVSGAQDGTIDTLLSTSIGTSALKFSSTFSSNDNDEIDLVWEEIDANGNSTYVI